MISGIRTIKSYGWENHYQEKIEVARKRQEHFVWLVNFVSSLGLTVFNNFGFFVYLAIVLCTYWRGAPMSPSMSMALLSVLFYLFMSINGITVYSVNTMFQFFAVCDRMGDVFQLEDHHSERLPAPTPQDVCVKINGGSYSWGFKVKKDKGQSALKDRLALDEDVSAVLSDVNLDLKFDDTIFVVGKIGNGKTTLIHSIMDETVKLSGSQEVRGKIAYVEQEPFIFSGTIEDNITFGLVYNEERFNHAIKVT
jgi:ABC-type multidrug transport system fused ATPase/permease subunit